MPLNRVRPGYGSPIPRKSNIIKTRNKAQENKMMDKENSDEDYSTIMVFSENEILDEIEKPRDYGDDNFTEMKIDYKLAYLSEGLKLTPLSNTLSKRVLRTNFDQASSSKVLEAEGEDNELKHFTSTPIGSSIIPPKLRNISSVSAFEGDSDIPIWTNSNKETLSEISVELYAQKEDMTDRKKNKKRTKKQKKLTENQQKNIITTATRDILTQLQTDSPNNREAARIKQRCEDKTSKVNETKEKKVRRKVKKDDSKDLKSDLITREPRYNFRKGKSPTSKNKSNQITKTNDCNTELKTYSKKISKSRRKYNESFESLEKNTRQKSKKSKVPIKCKIHLANKSLTEFTVLSKPVKNISPLDHFIQEDFIGILAKQWESDLKSKNNNL